MPPVTLVVDEEKMRSVGDVFCLTSVLWVPFSALILLVECQQRLSPKVLIWNWWRKKLRNWLTQVHIEKQLLKLRCWYKWHCMSAVHSQRQEDLIGSDHLDIPLPSYGHNWSNDDCLEGKRENYEVCSVQYLVQQLCAVQCTHTQTHTWTDLTVVCWLDLDFLWLYCVLHLFQISFLGLFCVLVYLCMYVCFYCVMVDLVSLVPCQEIG